MSPRTEEKPSPQQELLVSPDVAEVIKAAIESTKRLLETKLEELGPDRTALESAATAIRFALSAIIDLSNPDHPLTAIQDNEEFFDRLAHARGLKEELWLPEVRALIDRFRMAVFGARILGEKIKAVDEVVDSVKPRKPKAKVQSKTRPKEISPREESPKPKTVHLRFTPYQRSIVETIAAKPVGTGLQAKSLAKELKKHKAETGRILRFLASKELELLERKGGKAGPGVFYVVTERTPEALKFFPPQPEQKAGPSATAASAA